MNIKGHLFDELDADMRKMLRRAYRIVRVRIPYTAPKSPDHFHVYDGKSLRTNGQSYGMSRDEAKEFIYQFAREVDWHTYIGSK